MKPVQSACWALAASAFILAAILFVQIAALSPSKAKADMVIDKDNFSLMTAQTANNQESLFVVDDRTGYLLIYKMDIFNHRMVPIGAMDLNNYFAGGQAQNNSQQNQKRQQR